MLDVSQHRKTIQEMLAAKGPTKVEGHFSLIEFCCAENSEIGIRGEARGHNILRCTENEGNLLTAAGIARAFDFARKNRGCHVWGSIPCTAWSQLQYLNEHLHGHKPGFSARLAKARRQSMTLLKTFISLGEYVIKNGGTVTFEWPAKASGWKKPEIEGMIRKLGLRSVDIDGCSVGVVSRAGEKMVKPWKIATTSDIILKDFEKLVCSRDHDHVPCEGGEAKQSGFYTPKFARIIIRTLEKQEVTKMVNAAQKEREAMMISLTEELAHVATKEELKAFSELNKVEQNKLIEAARRVHINTGHRPPSSLAKLMRQQGAPLASRAAMEQVRCSSCEENKRPQSSPVATLDTAVHPWKTIGMDIKEAEIPGGKEKYLVIVDEATKLTRAVYMFTTPKGKFRNVTAKEVVQAYEENWESIFGNPEVLRHDPEGALTANEFMEAMNEKGVHLSATAGEAHWQLGITERMIGTVFRTAERIHKEHGVVFRRAVALAVSSQNTVDRVRGYSPAQWAFGKQPNWYNQLFDEKETDVNLARDGHESFAQKVQIQIEARKIYEEVNLQNKILRAKRAQKRKDDVFTPGDLVYVWRLGTGKLAGSKSTGIHRGAWFGPSRVLGTETTIAEGVAVPSSVIWVVVNDRLWRCAAQQIRRASEREQAEDVLRQPKPWTLEHVKSTTQLGAYRDLTSEPYPEMGEGDEDMDEDVQEPENEQEEPDEMEEDALIPKRKAEEEEPRARGNGMRYLKKSKKDSNIPEAFSAALRASDNISTAFFSRSEAPEKVIEIAFPCIEGDRHIRKYLKNPEAFVVTGLWKRRVEITEKHLTPEERELIRLAKGKEVKEFVREKVVERVRDSEHVAVDDIMKMRWVLTWKKDPDSPLGKKGKARLVVLGFQDPYLGQEQTCSPTLNKRSKQLLLQVVVQQKWELTKGDVTAASLQGRKLEKSKYALAPQELAEAMGLPVGERVVRLLKSVYGLTAAPLEWYAQVNLVLEKLGGVKCDSDPCVWTFVDPETESLVGIVGSHVDDFLIAGNNESDHWKACHEALMAAFRWTPLERESFKQCGVTITQNEDGSVTQDQDEYLSTMTEVELPKERAAQLTSPVTDQERTELRALLGGLQWLVGQSRVDGSIDVNLLQSCVATATVETVLAANKVLRKLRQGPSKLYTRRVPDGEQINLVAWSDASWANRRDGKSTGGYLIGLCGSNVLKGGRGHISVVSWGTNKLKRVARSSMAAEMQALANSEDELHLCRIAWAEFNGISVNLNMPERVLKEIPGTVIIDAKCIYDALTSQNQPLQLAEKRTALELLAYLKNTELNFTETRWVHGGANLADGLTKLGVHPMLREFLTTHTWSLVQDKSQMSGKKRQAKGLSKLTNEANRAEVDRDLEWESFRECAWEKLRVAWPDFCREDDSESDGDWLCE